MTPVRLPTSQATFQTVQLTASAEIDTYNPQLYVIQENTVTVSGPPGLGGPASRSEAGSGDGQLTGLRKPGVMCGEPPRVLAELGQRP